MDIVLQVAVANPGRVMATQSRDQQTQAHHESELWTHGFLTFR